ncbi:MAG TPA: RNA polymerase sigma factor [Ktedonobacterales bacterium]|nr:RNA polymerase sigma factor [Ktedonobacterales bacterium]
MDDEAFVAALSAVMSDALRMATALVGFSEADDIVQEATIRAWSGRATLRDRGSLRPWWLRIVYTTCLNWHKSRAGTQTRRTLSLDAGGITALMAGSADPGDSDHSAILDLHDAINRLDDATRPVIILRYFVGMDSATIGTILQIPAATVRTRLRKALASLRDTLLASPLSDKGGRSDV